MPSTTPSATASVQGVKHGPSSGGVEATSASGLPHTGFDLAILAIAVVMLGGGVTLLLVTRRRRAQV